LRFVPALSLNGIFGPWLRLSLIETSAEIRFRELQLEWENRKALSGTSNPHLLAVVIITYGMILSAPCPHPTHVGKAARPLAESYGATTPDDTVLPSSDGCVCRRCFPLVVLVVPAYSRSSKRSRAPLKVLCNQGRCRTTA